MKRPMLVGVPLGLAREPGQRAALKAVPLGTDRRDSAFCSRAGPVLDAVQPAGSLELAVAVAVGSVVDAVSGPCHRVVMPRVAVFPIVRSYPEAWSRSPWSNHQMNQRAARSQPLRVGVGGPVGSGKTDPRRGAVQAAARPLTTSRS